jgi:hypothetical protein
MKSSRMPGRPAAFCEALPGVLSSSRFLLVEVLHLPWTSAALASMTI